MKIRLVLFLILLFPLSVHAGEFHIAGKTIKLTGSLQQSDVALLKSVAEALGGDVTIDVAADTGSSETAMAIGRHIQQNRYATKTDLSDCRDICALIWLSGTPHTKSSDTRVHLGGLAGHSGIVPYLRSLGLNDRQTAALLTEKPQPEKRTAPVPQTIEAQEPSYLAGYDGELRDDVPHGTGSWTFANGDRFSGTFKDGRPHGSGVVLTAEGDRLNVVFDSGQVMGRPRLVGADGVKAELTEQGKLLRVLPDGALWFSPSPVSRPQTKAESRLGRKTDKPMGLDDGSVYEGALKDGKPHGFGKQTFPDGATFTGMFEDGRKNGPGILVTAQGMQRAGLWRNDDFRDGSKVGREIEIELVKETRSEGAETPVASMIPMGTLIGGLSRDEVRRLQTRLNTLHYDAGGADGRIGRQTRAAVDAYARDFELVEDDLYAEALIDWIVGAVPETEPGWRSVEGQNCQVYSQIVHAITDINWSGVCLEGYAHGRGVLKVTHRLNGKSVTYVYDGVVKRGRLTGSGTDRFEGSHPAANTVYQGTFVNGVREGAGTYTEPGLGRIEGSFDAGKPHGYGAHFDGDGKLIVSGEFNAGCLTSGTKKLAVLTTRQACGF